MQRLTLSKLVEKENLRFTLFSIAILKKKTISLIQLIQVIMRANPDLDFRTKAQMGMIQTSKEKVKTKKKMIKMNQI